MTFLNSRVAVLTLVFQLMGLLFVTHSYGQNTLHLKCERKEIDAFCRSVDLYENIKRIELEGTGIDVNWKRLTKALKKLPSLDDLLLLNNAFNALPKGISSLKSLQNLTVIGSEELAMESCLEVFNGLPNLKKITWELYELDAVPFDIILVEHLDTLVIIDGELADLRKFYPAVLKDEDLEHRFSKMAVPAASNSSIPIEVEFITMIEQMPVVKERHDPNIEISVQQDLQYTYAQRIETPAKPWIRNYSYVAPPLEEVQIQKEYYEVESSIPTVVCSERSGTQIIIPPNSFVDDNGKPIVGNVIVDYREFLNPADQILSGIPMSFINDEAVSLFRSAGMFEINASQDGKEVFLKENSQLTINFNSVDSLDRFQFYAFNDSTNSWDELGNADLGRVPVNLEEYNFSEAAHYYNRWSASGYTPSKPDTTSFVHRYESLCYFGTKRDWRNHDIGVDYSYCKRSSTTFRMKRIRRSKGKVIFSLEGSMDNNPEMKRIRVDDWRVISNTPIKTLRSNFHRKRFFCDIRIFKDGEAFVMQLKDDTSFSNLRVMPMQRYHKKGRTYYEDRDLKLDNYNKSLRMREKQFEKGQKRYIRQYNYKVIKRNDNWTRNFWLNTTALMTPEERDLNQEQWKTYCDSIKMLGQQDFAKVKVGAGSFTRSLSIDGFGIFNCDQIKRLDNPIVISASYESKIGLRFDAKCAYVIDKNINGVLTYDGYGNMSPKFFALDPKSVLSIVVFDKEGKMGMVNLDQLKGQSLRNHGRYTLEVETIETPMSVTDFRSKIGI